MTPKTGATPALRLNLGGAPSVWHTVGDHPGLWHPVIAVPVDVVDGDEEWARPLDKAKGVPLELVYITDDEADAGREAFADATGESHEALLARLNRPMARTGSDGSGVDGLERERVMAEAMNAKAKVQDKE